MLQLLNSPLFPGMEHPEEEEEDGGETTLAPLRQSEHYGTYKIIKPDPGTWS